MKEAPAWWRAAQARFEAALRAPVDPHAPRTRVAPDAAALRDLVPGATRTAAAGLAVYRRQYWLRLTDALRSEWPLTARLLGATRFGAHAEAFLLAHPPTGFDIADAANGFDDFLRSRTGELDELPEEALADALAVDAGWREVFGAKAEPIYVPGAADAARLPTARLVPRSGWRVVRERWPMVELRRSLAGAPDDVAVALPPRRDAPASWLLVRTHEGAAELPLTDEEATLLGLLRERPLVAALAVYEAACAARLQADLPARVGRLLARSVALGLWAGLAAESR